MSRTCVEVLRGGAAGERGRGAGGGGGEGFAGGEGGLVGREGGGGNELIHDGSVGMAFTLQLYSLSILFNLTYSMPAITLIFSSSEFYSTTQSTFVDEGQYSFFLSAAKVVSNIPVFTRIPGLTSRNNSPITV